MAEFKSIGGRWVPVTPESHAPKPVKASQVEAATPPPKKEETKKAASTEKTKAKKKD